MQSTFRKHTESKADSDSRFRVLVLDSSLDLESKIDSQSHQNLESSLLDSLSHGYCLDSQNRLFAQKKKGFPLSPHSQSPEKDKAPLFLLRFACNPLGLFGSHKVYLLAGVPRFFRF